MNLGTPTAAKIMGATGLVAVLVLGWTFAVGPETAKLDVARDQITTAQDQNALLTAQLARLVKQQAQLDQVRRTERALARKFPPTADQPGLFEIVTAAAVDAGIGANGVTTLAPTPPIVGSADGAAAPASDPAAASSTTTSGGDLARQTVTVAATGTYDQTQQLLVNLEHMRRAYLISSVSLSQDSSTGVFTTTIAGDMFVMPPIDAPKKTVDVSVTTAEEDS